MLKKIFTLFAITILTPSFALAADMRSGEIVNIDQSSKNLYLVGTTVNINSETKGDLVAAGSEIVVSESVEDSLFAFGGAVKLRGEIGKSARIAGGAINVENKIGSDLFVGAGTFSSSETMHVLGDLYIGGGTLNINGKVEGETKISASSVTLNGEFKGNVYIEAENINLSDKTKIDGKLTYISKNSAKIAQETTIIGGIDYQKSYPKTGIQALKSSDNTFDLLLTILSIILVAYIVIKYFKNFADSTVNSSTSNPLKNAWNGFVFIILTPLASLLVSLTIVGLTIGFFGMIVYAGLLIIASAIATIFTGKLVMNLIKSEQNQNDILLCVIGALVFVGIGYIPVLGWFIKAVIMIIATGATIEYFMKKFKPAQPNKQILPQKNINTASTINVSKKSELPRTNKTKKIQGESNVKRTKK